MIVSFYASGMTIRDIQHHLTTTIDSELSHETTSKITHEILDEVVAWQTSYLLLLMVRTDLPLEDVLALDRVQKKLPISADATARLRKAKLIEGRKPHLHGAATVADAAGTRGVHPHPGTGRHFLCQADPRLPW